MRKVYSLGLAAFLMASPAMAQVVIGGGYDAARHEQRAQQDRYMRVVTLPRHSVTPRSGTTAAPPASNMRLGVTCTTRGARSTRRIAMPTAA